MGRQDRLTGTSSPKSRRFETHLEPQEVHRRRQTQHDAPSDPAYDDTTARRTHCPDCGGVDSTAHTQSCAGATLDSARHADDRTPLNRLAYFPAFAVVSPAGILRAAADLFVRDRLESWHDRCACRVAVAGRKLLHRDIRLVGDPAPLEHIVGVYEYIACG